MAYEESLDPGSVNICFKSIETLFEVNYKNQTKYVVICLKVITCSSIKVDLFKSSNVFFLVEIMPYPLFSGQNRKQSRSVKKSETVILNESFEL